MPKLKAISGARQQKAPSPKRGMVRAVYETVEALGGATEKDIYRYLPAAVTDSGQVTTHKRLKKLLVNAVYRGYLIHDSKADQYRIAPRSYYEARVNYLKTLGKKHRKYPESLSLAEPGLPVEANLPISWLVVSFVLGLFSGAAFGFAVGALL